MLLRRLTIWGKATRKLDLRNVSGVVVKGRVQMRLGSRIEENAIQELITFVSMSLGLGIWPFKGTQ